MWWMMMLVTALVGVNGNSHPPLSCEEARFKCAQRQGCGMALQNYVTGCSAVLQGYQQSYCPEICQHSLIALTSTEEGQELMRCQCSDKFCEDSKNRVEICRTLVMNASLTETVVSCTVAHLICAADASCSTAYEYYDHYCRSMFHGRKCTHRCRNSISILRRQEKSAKLKTCRCDGRDEFDCRKVQSNMARLCFHKEHPSYNSGGRTTETSNVIPQTENKNSSGGALRFCVSLMMFVLVTLT